jgi:hypothetical protein
MHKIQQPLVIKGYIGDDSIFNQQSTISTTTSLAQPNEEWLGNYSVRCWLLYLIRKKVLVLG